MSEYWQLLLYYLLHFPENLLIHQGCVLGLITFFLKPIVKSTVPHKMVGLLVSRKWGTIGENKNVLMRNSHTPLPTKNNKIYV
jgi:hypothetical protein